MVYPIHHKSVYWRLNDYSGNMDPSYGFVIISRAGEAAGTCGT